jgi:DNA repair photolyase
VFLKYRNPVGIITKNALILRDLDILKPLAEMNLVRVMISITTLDESLRRVLEPRTASVNQKLKTIQSLSEAAIPVGVMMAPVIPSLTNHEILPLAKKVSEAGASSLGYTMLRLNGPLAELFENWLKENYPDRADRILNQVKAVHGGQLADSRFGSRMRGEGEIAEVIIKQFQIAKNKYFAKRGLPELNLSLFRRPDKVGDQLTLL